MNIPRSSSEQDDIVNSLNYEGIAVIDLRILPLSWQWQTACWLCHRLEIVWMISSYGDQSATENNPSYYYRASPTLPQLLWMLPETPYVLYMQLQHQGNS